MSHTVKFVRECEIIIASVTCTTWFEKNNRAVVKKEERIVTAHINSFGKNIHNCSRRATNPKLCQCHRRMQVLPANLEKVDREVAFCRK